MILASDTIGLGVLGIAIDDMGTYIASFSDSATDSSGYFILDPELGELTLYSGRQGQTYLGLERAVSVNLGLGSKFFIEEGMPPNEITRSQHWRAY